ncbi:MAG: ATP-dependent acyl-CoA ligase [Rhizobiales bacterium 65-9]|nr:ATP-dependent acyl-CoA ligase [Hyphomicrobiales bacterium]OJY35580.1 MAG: ATP-dependent acyl-CoA ligase [Rhizobiales bacterium 65-9]
MSDLGRTPGDTADAVTRFAPAERTLPTLLQRQAERYGDRRLLVFGDVVWTFAETVEIAAASARTLAEAGLRHGDRVAILCSNRPEFLRVYLGCAWLGAIAAPINTALRGGQLEHVLRNAGPSLLVIEDASIPALDTIDPTLLPEKVWIVGDAPPQSPAHWTGLPALGEGMAPGQVRPGDTVAILYTSGTTGPAKGVCCPQAQMFWWGVYSARALGIREGETLLTTLPLFHTNALNAFYQAILNGCVYVLEPKFSASGFWESIRRHEANVGYLLGAMAAILLAQPEKPTDREHKLRVALGGGVPARFHDVFRTRFNVPLLDGYGSTETNFAFASPIPSDHPGSLGYLVHGIEARIVDENDAPVPDGVSGELLLRPTEAHSFASGYYNMPEKTVEAWRNLWFHSGDRVVRESDGHYRFIDRIKDTIRRRGENVSSWEVEQILLAHPAIGACAVYPLPSELGEDEVAVAIQLRPGAALTPEEALRHCEGKLAYFALPRFLTFVEALPLTENGKISKPTLRAAGVRAETWDREKSGYQVKR